MIWIIAFGLLTIQVDSQPASERDACPMPAITWPWQADHTETVSFNTASFFQASQVLETKSLSRLKRQVVSSNETADIQANITQPGLKSGAWEKSTQLIRDLREPLHN